MALGDTYNNNQQKNYSPSVISGYRFSNPDSNIDKTCLTFTFWNKLLKISIVPKKETSDDTIAYDYDNAGAVYLSHTKALIFYKELVKFIADYNVGNAPTNTGVNTGQQGLIYVCDGKEFNANGPCIVIRKINESGHSESNYVYEVKTNAHAAVVNYDEKSAKFDSTVYDLLELEQLAILLKDYYEAMTMSIAYSVQESNKYDASRLNTKLRLISEKLGIETKSRNQQQRTVNSSYFSNASNGSGKPAEYNAPSTVYENGSLDDLD